MSRTIIKCPSCGAENFETWINTSVTGKPYIMDKKAYCKGCGCYFEYQSTYFTNNSSEESIKNDK